MWFEEKNKKDNRNLYNLSLYCSYVDGSLRRVSKFSSPTEERKFSLKSDVLNGTVRVFNKTTKIFQQKNKVEHKYLTNNGYSELTTKKIKLCSYLYKIFQKY